MNELSPEEKRKIYEEERVRLEAQEKIKKEKGATSETEKLAKGLNRGMKFAGWLVLFVILGWAATCIFLISI